MEEIKKQVQRAHRRLTLDQFVKVLSWSLFAVLILAVAALAVPKIWVLELDSAVWMWSWVGGALGAGLILACLITYARRRRSIEAAIEIDRRFGLKERVASAMALTENDRESEAGQALLKDASRRVERLNIREQFGLAVSWRNLLPLLPAIAVFALTMLDDRVNPEAEAAKAAKASERLQVRKVTKKLQTAFKKKKKELEEKNLTNLDPTMAKMQTALDELDKKKNADKKDALLKLNDVAKDLAKRQNALGGLNKMKQQLQKMKDFQKGPADKMANALKQGNFKQAMNELRKMQKQLKNGKMTPEQQKQLAKQMDQMQQKIQKMAQKQQQAKQQLRQQIAQKKRQGDLAGAGKLQRQLDKLNAQNKQMNQMQQMAQKMQQAAQNLKNGQQQKAGQQLDKLAKDLQQMQQQMNELKTVDEVMNQIADAKQMMQGGNDGGDMFGQGMGQGNNMENNKKGGQGMGAGRGQGVRPEAKNKTGTIDSKVAQNVQKGQVVRTGVADGANLPGVSQEEIKRAVLAEFSEEAEPIENQPLPKNQRKHSNEYFERLRSGQ